MHYELLLWADIELGMALFAASAAALRPLLGLLPKSPFSANINSRSKKQHHPDSSFSQSFRLSSKGVARRHSHVPADGLRGPYREVSDHAREEVEDVELGIVGS